VITTIAGNGQENFSGDNGPAINAELNSPNGVAVADDGTLYVADYGNNRVRRVSPTGVITSAAGNGQNGYRGDGALATAAELSSPTDVALGGGSLYIVDFGNGRIRRVNPAGVVSTVAGNGERTFSGDDGVATAAALSRPNGVTVARDGSFYIADSGNNRIRRVSPTGLITTVAGNGQDGFSGDHGRATSAALSGPAAAAIAGDGSLYIADAGNNRIRHVSASGVITTVAGITTTS
jgi:sugar lactone lactonase YvrE